jgi:hypothetical protein
MPKGRFSKIPSALLLIFSLFIVYGTILPFNVKGMENFHYRITEINWIPFQLLMATGPPFPIVFKTYSFLYLLDFLDGFRPDGLISELIIG